MQEVDPYFEFTPGGWKALDFNRYHPYHLNMLLNGPQ